MFAGKTTMLLSKIDRFERTDKPCIIIRSSKDTRTLPLQTHSNIEYFGDVMMVDSLGDLDDSLIKENEVIGIDEGHFFSPEDLEAFLNRVEKIGNKIVIIAMLKATHEREAFKGYDFLYARATDIHLLDSVCELCKGRATNTRMREGAKTDTLVGGKEKYFPCCNKCWNKPDRRGG